MVSQKQEKNAIFAKFPSIIKKGDCTPDKKGTAHCEGVSMKRIINIDKDKCNGCGLCATACHEGAIEMQGGKAHLAREDFCDGLGDCLPACPTGAISFEEREAIAYDGAAADAAKESRTGTPTAKKPCACPGSTSRLIEREECDDACPITEGGRLTPSVSRLAQWPCQIKLVPTRAPYFDGARLLIAADCTAYAYASFHNDLMRGHVTLIGCPKLDAADYAEKLTAIIRDNDVRSVRVVRMEVPCCGGIESAARRAIAASGKIIPWQVLTVSTDGKIRE